MNSSSGSDRDGLVLPQPDDAAIAHSARLVQAISARIEQCGGVIGFDEYMHMALYEPGLGYYSGNAIKFGALGDFVTAPEISPLFGCCLARQAAALFEQGCNASILEFGAGSGRLCEQVLSALPELDNYLILDLGAELKQRQHDYLRNRLAAELFAKITWLERLPENFDGVVLANELLDAMPVHLLHRKQDWCELGVARDGQKFAWQEITPGSRVLDAMRTIEARFGQLPRDYLCELNLNYAPWFAALAQSCGRAVILIIDYGYEQNDYYHPDRRRGTLECYYRHRVHDDPLILPGLQDITAFVDFDACADAAEANNFEIIGLVSQRRFLLANGLLEAAREPDEGGDVHERLTWSQQVKRLSMPDEMGHRFKVLAMQKNMALEMPAMLRAGSYG